MAIGARNLRYNKGFFHLTWMFCESECGPVVTLRGLFERFNNSKVDFLETTFSLVVSERHKKAGPDDIECRSNRLGAGLKRVELT